MQTEWAAEDYGKGCKEMCLIVQIKKETLLEVSVMKC